MTDPIWRLVKTAEGRIHLLWTQGDDDHVLDLGPVEDAMEAMAGFLAAQDFGE